MLQKVIACVVLAAVLGLIAAIDQHIRHTWLMLLLLVVAVAGGGGALFGVIWVVAWAVLTIKGS